MAQIRFNYGDKFTQPVSNNIGIGSTIPTVKVVQVQEVLEFQVLHHFLHIRDL